MSGNASVCMCHSRMRAVSSINHPTNVYISAAYIALGEGGGGANRTIRCNMSARESRHSARSPFEGHTLPYPIKFYVIFRPLLYCNKGKKE